MLGCFSTISFFDTIKKTFAFHQKETEVTSIKNQNHYITELPDLKGVKVKKLE